MGLLTEHVNTAILPVDFKAVISHIIEKFPEYIEIVIAVGHKKEVVEHYISLAHPERKIRFVEVDKYMGPGTGPGYSLLQCREHLQCPFIFCAADTLVIEKIPEPNENWLGIAPVKETERFCTVKIKNNLVIQLDDKIKCDNKYAFIGLAGVKDYDIFFGALETDRKIKSGEIQVSNGLSKLIERKLIPTGFTWFDTGTLDSYKETNQSFSGRNKQFDLSKVNEFLYFVNGRVIKFFADKNIIDNRYERSKKLKGLCPEIESKRGNFYSYKKIDGQVLYEVLDRQVVRDFLYWIKQNLWKEIELTDEQKIEFNQNCKKFYYDKTIERIKKFYEKTGIEDTPSNINGVNVPSLKELLNKLDWQYLFNGVPTNFHGDLQFDNILVTIDSSSNLQKFVLLDWRQDFGDTIDYGDLYYDLAKLYGGMTVSYQLIRNKEFSFDMSGSSVYYNFNVKNDLLDAKEEFEEFLINNKFDITKIKILTSLIFLNMAPLLKDPLDLMIYFIGKTKLYYALKERGVYN
jgi:dTDP-glucose pyrophosphorylase